MSNISPHSASASSAKPDVETSKNSTTKLTPRKKRKREDRNMFVDHETALRFLDSRINVERTDPNKVDSDVWKLDRMRAMLKVLGNPQDGLEVIHIAGSKGKGSVCNMLESALEGCGYTTGVFTSPHLTDITERVRVGGQPLKESIFDSALEQCRDAAFEVEEQHGKATYFELLTALSFIVFAQLAVDFVVLETGIGGRVDCTNVVNPRICGLTEIQLEHTDILGDTIELIAAEKAGIIKSNTIAISTNQSDEVKEVFREQADKVGATLKFLGDGVPYSRRFQSGVGRGPHARVCVGEEGEGFEHLSVPLMGMHQADNCGLVLAIIMELRNLGFDLSERMVCAGLEQIDSRGRLEKIMDRPRIYIDGAHTPDSVRETLKAVGAHVDYDSLIVIFGCAADKDVNKMLLELDRGADKILFTQVQDNPRSMSPEDLYSRFSEELEGTSMAETKPSVRDAINDAARAVGGNDLILLLGSFYIAGEAKQLVEARKSRR